MSVYVDW